MVSGNGVAERIAAVVVARLVVDIEEVMVIELCEIIWQTVCTRKRLLLGAKILRTATNNHFSHPPN